MAYFPFLVVGGGIGGVTCAETLLQLDEKIQVGLITASNTVKCVTNLQRITKLVEDFTITEKSIAEFSELKERLTVIKDVVEVIDYENHSVILSDSSIIKYTKLCICCGGRPKLIENNEFVVGIRDTESIEMFRQRLTDCKRVAIVGNGGIATELVYEIADCELLWIIKDKSISTTFFDPAAARFLLDSLSTKIYEDKGAKKVNEQRHHYCINGRDYTTEQTPVTIQHFTGGALGPDWAQGLTMRGNCQKVLKVIYEAEVVTVHSDVDRVRQLWLQNCSKQQSYDGSKVALVLSDGSVHFCDLVVSATGVVPTFPRLHDGSSFVLSDKDGGILVSDEMRTSIEDIYAAGDCCTANWPTADHWFQMRLWTQARLMAFRAAKCMHAAIYEQPVPLLDFGFDLFTHVTKIFGYSVILLGMFNGQRLQLSEMPNAELLVRTSPSHEYIKCVVVDGRLQGAVLIGDTEMAETLEDLIVDGIDISMFGEYLLDPSIDIMDYFD